MWSKPVTSSRMLRTMFILSRLNIKQCSTSVLSTALCTGSRIHLLGSHRCHHTGRGWRHKDLWGSHSVCPWTKWGICRSSLKSLEKQVNEQNNKLTFFVIINLFLFSKIGWCDFKTSCRCFTKKPSSNGKTVIMPLNHWQVFIVKQMQKCWIHINRRTSEWSVYTKTWF